MKWIKQPRGSNLRPVTVSTKFRLGMKEALRLYAKREGVNVTDIIDTKLMKDKDLREILERVLKEHNDRAAKEDSKEGSR